MDETFTMEQLKSLPKTFKMQCSENYIRLKQNIIEELKQDTHAVYSEEMIIGDQSKEVDYFLEKEGDAYRLIRCNRSGYFSGITNERKETKRGLLELWKKLGIQNETTLLYDRLIEKMNNHQFPKKLNGFHLVQEWNRMDVVDFVSGNQNQLYLALYGSKVGAVGARMKQGETLFVGERQSVGVGVENALPCIEKEMRKLRMKLLFAN